MQFLNIGRSHYSTKIVINVFIRIVELIKFHRKGFELISLSFPIIFMQLTPSSSKPLFHSSSVNKGPVYSGLRQFFVTPKFILRQKSPRVILFFILFRLDISENAPMDTFGVDYCVCISTSA